MWIKLTEISVELLFAEKPSIVENGREKCGIENGVPLDDLFEQVSCASETRKVLTQPFNVCYVCSKFRPRFPKANSK